MIIPNKVVSLKASALGVAGLVLEQGPDPVKLAALYESLDDRFESIDQFLLTIDLLFVLGRIDVDFNSGMLSYAD